MKAKHLYELLALVSFMAASWMFLVADLKSEGTYALLLSLSFDLMVIREELKK